METNRTYFTKKMEQYSKCIDKTKITKEQKSSFAAILKKNDIQVETKLFANYEHVEILNTGPTDVYTKILHECLEDPGLKPIVQSLKSGLFSAGKDNSMKSYVKVRTMIDNLLD